MDRRLIDLLYYVPPENKQWPSWRDWLYAIAFVAAFFGVVPMIGWMAGM